MAIYAVVATAGVASFGYLTHERVYYFCAPACGLFLFAFGSLLTRVRTMNIDDRLRRSAPREWLKDSGKTDDPG
jgi:hypothetical protein